MLLQLLPHELETDVLVDQPQQVGLRNLIFQAEVIEQCLRAVVLPFRISRKVRKSSSRADQSFPTRYALLGVFVRSAFAPHPGLMR